MNIAIDYDALHDREPAAVEWLESIGFLKDDAIGELRMDNFSIDYVTRSRHLPIYFENRRLIDNPTSGQLLMMLSVFVEGGK